MSTSPTQELSPSAKTSRTCTRKSSPTSPQFASMLPGNCGGVLDMMILSMSLSSIDMEIGDKDEFMILGESAGKFNKHLASNCSQMMNPKPLPHAWICKRSSCICLEEPLRLQSYKVAKSNPRVSVDDMYVSNPRRSHQSADGNANLQRQTRAVSSSPRLRFVAPRFESVENSCEL